MLGDMTSPVSDTSGARALEAAQWAWEVHGEPLEVRSTPINGHAHIASLAAMNAKRVEFVVQEDDPDVWEALTHVNSTDAWQLCALVPLSLLGVAHDRLRGHRFELQGWWHDGDRVAFSNPEIA